MKILIVTNHFYPEEFKCNDMAFELQRRGHQVSVMTAIPDYPGGRFHKGYGVFKKRRETINGVTVHRSLIIPRGTASSLRLALNYASYTFFASVKAIWFSIVKKYDAIIVHETSPVMVGIPAVIIKKIRKTPVHFWVLDLWPESLSAAGGINNRHILSVFNRLTISLYKNSDSILISSKGFKDSIVKKGDFDSKIEYFPNWIDDGLINGEYLTTPEFPQGFNVVFAGNIGDAQDIPHIMQAALLLKGEKINFIFIGDGRRKEYIEEFSAEHDLRDQVKCLGRYPVKYMSSFFSKADVMIMALKDEPIFHLTIPARLQAFMSSGKPIIAMINGEGAKLIEEADCGWAVQAENHENLAECIHNVATMAPEQLKVKGENGRNYCEKYFKFFESMDHLEQIIHSEITRH